MHDHVTPAQEGASAERRSVIQQAAKAAADAARDHHRVYVELTRLMAIHGTIHTIDTQQHLMVISLDDSYRYTIFDGKNHRHSTGEHALTDYQQRQRVRLVEGMVIPATPPVIK